MRSHGKLYYEGVARALRLDRTDGPAPALRREAGPDPQDPPRPFAAASSSAGRSEGLARFRPSRGKDRPRRATGSPRRSSSPARIPGIRQAYRIVEDMMLVTNETVAAHLKRHAAPGVFRVHGKPDPERISMFCQVAKSFGYELEEEAAVDAQAAQPGFFVGSKARTRPRCSATCSCGPCSKRSTTPTRPPATSRSPRRTTCTSPRRSDATRTCWSIASCGA